MLGLDVAWLVFMDEIGANTSMAILYAWARRVSERGRKCRATVTQHTALASMIHEGLGPCEAVVGSISANSNVITASPRIPGVERAFAGPHAPSLRRTCVQVESCEAL